MRVIRVGIAGLGTVGGEVARLLRERQSDFMSRLGAEVRIAAVCDRRAAAKAAALRLPSRVRRVASPLDLAGDPELDVVVETIGGLSEARRLILAALRAGKHVVTANKQVLSHHWTEIIRASQRAHRRVYFEASVAGGIPILHALHQSLAANRIRRVLGILNGTTNFILTEMAHDNLPMPEAVARAQKLGLAERNPRLDLDGTDAAHKVSIIASLLTGRWIRPAMVARAGILDVSPQDIAFAVAELDRTIRLLGCVEIGPGGPAPGSGGVLAYVAPVLIPLDHPLASVHGENNALLVETSAAGDLMFYGKGAGAGPAASAVVGDIFMLSQEILQRRHTEITTALWGEARRPSPWARRPGAGLGVVSLPETEAPFYLRLQVLDRPGVLAKIAGILGRNKISIAQIHQGAEKGPRSRSMTSSAVPVFITTHSASQGAMDRARREIAALSSVSPRHACFRMLNH